MAPAEVTTDYYAVLEVPPNATVDAINKSYRRLALLRHPDRNSLSENATATFQLLQNAYQTLSSPTERQAYDIAYAGTKAPNEYIFHRTETNDASLGALNVELKTYKDQCFECKRTLQTLEAEVQRLRDLDVEEEKEALRSEFEDEKKAKRERDVWEARKRQEDEWKEIEERVLRAEAMRKQREEEVAEEEDGEWHRRMQGLSLRDARER